MYIDKDKISGLKSMYTSEKSKLESMSKAALVEELRYKTLDSDLIAAHEAFEILKPIVQGMARKNFTQQSLENLTECYHNMLRANMTVEQNLAARIGEILLSFESQLKNTEISYWKIFAENTLNGIAEDKPTSFGKDMKSIRYLATKVFSVDEDTKKKADGVISQYSSIRHDAENFIQRAYPVGVLVRVMDLFSFKYSSLNPNDAQGNMTMFLNLLNPMQLQNPQI